MKQEKPSPPPSSYKTLKNKRECTQDLQHKENSSERSIVNNTNCAMQGSTQITNKTHAQHLNTSHSEKNRRRKAFEHAEEQPGCQGNVEKNTANSNNCVIDRNVIQKINAAEEIRTCYTDESPTKQEMNKGFQVALQNFGGKEKNIVDSGSAQKIQVVKKTVSQGRQLNKSTVQKDASNCNADQQESASPNEAKEVLSIHYSTSGKEQEKAEDKVVLRNKKAKKETEDERRQRLSVHKDEIMRGNVKAAMEIFENLRKREELKTILTQVQEIEGETSEVNVGSLKTLFENVPAWIVTPSKNEKQSITKGKKKVEKESQNTEVEGGTSVEAAFGDLEKASKEIMNLKEQTLAKLIDIEEAIRKALYSVSNLKSEADIAGLSGLFNESLNTEQSCPATNNIRKICIVSSKAKTDKDKQTSGTKMKDCSDPSKTSEVAPEVAPVLNKSPVKQCMSSPSSPSFISIHSAARRPAEQHTSPKTSTFKPKKEGGRKSFNGVNSDVDQSKASGPTNQFCSPASPKRKVSVLEVQTVPEAAAGVIGTKTVSEKYEETDCFGNKYVSSKTSTFVTKQSETKASSVFEVVSSPTRYEVMTSPVIRRSGRPFTESTQSNVKEGGAVFVTFGQSKAGKK